MPLPPTLSKHWQELSDLTIDAAALWMAIERDPIDHEFDCEHNDKYTNYFNEHPGGLQAVHQKSFILISAVRSGNIRVTPMQIPSGSLITSKTYIPKRAWVEWCRENGYIDLSNLFSQNIAVATPTLVSTQVITAPTVISPSSPTIATTPHIAQINSTYSPFNAVGKLVVKAAINIEQSTGISATAKQVMAKLQEWAESGIEPATLMKSDKSNRSVIWKTDKQAEKTFSTEACSKVLKRFNDGRQ